MNLPPSGFKAIAILNEAIAVLNEDENTSKECPIVSRQLLLGMPRETRDLEEATNEDEITGNECKTQNLAQNQRPVRPYMGFSGGYNCSALLAEKTILAISSR